MNQEPNQNLSPDQTPVPTSASVPPLTPEVPRAIDTKNSARTRILLIVAGVVVLALIGFGAYTVMQAGTKKNNQAVTDATSEQESQKTAPTNNSDEITTSLPNGKTATYANTEANQNLVFFSSDKGASYVDVSSKAIEQYISTTDKSIVTKLCGAHGELAQIDNIIIATISTDVRMASYPEDTSCLHELATIRNSDATSRSAAVALIAQVNTDVKDFYSTAIIE